MTSFPPRVRKDVTSGLGRGVIGRASDPSRLLIDRNRYLRPSLQAGGKVFIWPGGTEGITISGSATAAEHKYFDDNKIVVQVTHRDNRQIVLSGMFTGATAAKNVRDLTDVIVAEQPHKGKILSVPSIFIRTQTVMVSDYNFDHAEDDQTDSFTYTITFKFLGVGDKLKNPKTIVPRISLNPLSGWKLDRGSSPRSFRVHDGARTLRAIASIVYGNPKKWHDIYVKNAKILSSLGPVHKLPTKPLPIGMVLKY